MKNVQTAKVVKNVTQKFINEQLNCDKTIMLSSNAQLLVYEEEEVNK
jgi:hypothetical protein